MGEFASSRFHFVQRQCCRPLAHDDPPGKLFFLVPRRMKLSAAVANLERDTLTHVHWKQPACQ